MKKLIAVLAMSMMFMVSTSTQAQVYNAPMSISTADDTLVNADTAYLYTSQFTMDYDLSFKLTQTKVSGTVGGSAILQGSFTSSPSGNWISIKSDPLTAYASQYVDSLATVGNATASYSWLVPKIKAAYPFYRIRVITTGTQVSVPTAVVSSYFRKS